jgi:hypothetical protein
MFILAFYFLTNTLCRQTLSIKSLGRIDKEHEKVSQEIKWLENAKRWHLNCEFLHKLSQSSFFFLHFLCNRRKSLQTIE